MLLIYPRIGGGMDKKAPTVPCRAVYPRLDREAVLTQKVKGCPALLLFLYRERQGCCVWLFVGMGVVGGGLEERYSVAGGVVEDGDGAEAAGDV